MKINYNIPAMVANNALKNNDNKLSESTKRLATGMKIAGAKDNPAGLAISRRMNAQIRSLDRSTDNASDGISVVQTADGALNEVHDILQRMNELAIQAANGTNSASDLQNIQDEIVELKDEIKRISEATQFNGQTLLDGTFDMKGYAATNKMVDDGTGNMIHATDASGKIYETDPDITVNSYSDSVESGEYVIGGYNEIPGTDGKMKDPGTDPTDRDVLYAEYDERTGEVTLYDKEGNVTQDLHMNIYKTNRVGNVVTYELYMKDAAVTTEGATVKFATSDGKSMEIRLTENYNRESDASGLMTNVNDDDKRRTINLELTGTGPMTMQIGANEGQTLDVRIPPVSLENLGIDNIDFTRTVRRSDIDITSKDFTWAVVDDITANISYLTVKKDSISNSTKPDDALATAAWNTVVEYGEKMTAYADELWKAVREDSTLPDDEKEVLLKGCDDKLLTEINAMRADPQWVGKEEERETRIKSLFDERYRQLSKDISNLNDGEQSKNLDGTPKTSLQKLSTFYSDNYVTRDFQKKLDSMMDYRRRSALPATDPDHIDPTDPNYIGSDWQAGLQIDSILHASYDSGMKAPHSGADDGITAIGNAIKKVSAIRSRLGAYQNRLEHTVKANDGTSENMTAAYSRVMDVDMAEEMTTYTTQQVLSQAGTSMLAQANERPSQILQLLQ